MIPMRVDFSQQIFSISGAGEFGALALEIYRHQYRNVPVYRDYCIQLGKRPHRVERPDQIPFLPIAFFRERQVLEAGQAAETVFCSSGTTGTISSRHLVADLGLYEQSLMKGFQLAYGNPSGYCILALLPSYLERQDSSLVHMVRKLMEAGRHPQSGFYLNNLGELSDKLQRLEKSGQKVLLIGVSFALLDLAEQFPQKLSHTVIMETGGMKGRRKEITRQELHSTLHDAFGVRQIHSEYGMTEMLSQAYSMGNGIYRCPPWMKIRTRDIYDPFSYVEQGRTGGINVIDLANVHSCTFIETADIGRILSSAGDFEVLGRIDHSDTRGCNLMAG